MKIEKVTGESAQDKSVSKVSQNEFAPEKVEHFKSGYVIAIVVIITAALLFFSIKGFDFGKNTTGATTSTTYTIDQLHQLNLEGKLTPAEGYIYNLYSFVKYDGLWWTEISANDALVKTPLHFGPKEVEFIDVEGELSPTFNSQEEVYIAIDPAVVNKFYSLSISELSLNLAKGIGRTPVGSCTSEAEACANRTIISCEENQGLPVIELMIQDKPEVEYKGNCVLIKGNEYNLVRATDRLLLTWYGIMQP